MVVCAFLLSKRLPSRDRNSKHAMLNVRNSTAREHVSRRLSVNKIGARKTRKALFLPVGKLEHGDCRSIQLWGWEKFSLLCVTFCTQHSESRKKFCFPETITHNNSNRHKRNKTRHRAMNDLECEAYECLLFLSF